MASTYSPTLRIQLIATGEQANTWGAMTNTNLGTLIEEAISGSSSVDVTAGNVVLTTLNGVTDQARKMVIIATGTPGVARTITAPAFSKTYTVHNNSNAVLNFIASGAAGVSFAVGAKKIVYFDGTNFAEAINALTSPTLTTPTINGNLTLTNNLTISSGGALRGSYGTGAIASNIALGDLALNVNTTGYSNTAVGASALKVNTTGHSNTAIGASALTANTTGDHNVGIGLNALGANTTGIDNIGIGHQALAANTEGNSNVGIGYYALSSATGPDVTFCVGIGYGVLSTTTGSYGEVGIGMNVLQSSSGYQNVGIGYEALKVNTSGSQNIGIGYRALDANTLGAINIGIGSDALGANTEGVGSVGIGSQALRLCTGSYNVGIGSQALLSCTIGTNNTAIGSNALENIITGSRNVGLGRSAAASSATVSNEVSIYNGTVNARFQGSASSWTFVSDARDKTAIENLPLGLDFITQLQPRKFQWDLRSTDTDKGKEASGFIAQEVLAVLESNNAVYTGVVNTDDPNQYALAQPNLIPMLVNAIKELKAEIDLLKAKV